MRASLEEYLQWQQSQKTTSLGSHVYMHLHKLSCSPSHKCEIKTQSLIWQSWEQNMMIFGMLIQHYVSNSYILFLDPKHKSYLVYIKCLRLFKLLNCKKVCLPSSTVQIMTKIITVKCKQFFLQTFTWFDLVSLRNYIS